MVPILLNLDFLLESRHMGSARDSSRQDTGSYFGPEVRFEAVITQSNIFQAQVVIHCVSQFLFASKVVLSRLHGCMAKQELNLFKLAPSQVA
jgi:hypothetical protein